MDFKGTKKTFKELKISNASLQIANPILVIALVVSLFINLQKDTIVISNLNESCKALNISSSEMNQDTHIRLGYYLSGLLGNVNPKNAKFITSSVLSFIDPAIYQEVQNALDIQIGQVIQDEISVAFTPERSVYENGKTFITGRASVIGPTGLTNRFIRTYEFKFNVENYTPSTSVLDIYDGVPHDSEWKRKQKRLAEKGKK